MKIQEFVEQFAIQFEESDSHNIHQSVDFKKLKTWDSLTSISIQVMIEDEYNVKISPDDLKQTKTVYELFELVKSKNQNE